MEITNDMIEKFVGLVKHSYEEAKNIKNKNIKNKELNDIVTDIDLFMEEKIVEAIKQWYPNHSFIQKNVAN